jgi:HD superfamily phosphohydrolase
LNKKKIINDPVYGFITIRSELIFDIIDHPYFQRLRRIKQLGLTDLIYPGAHHTRFHHAIGAMHLMTGALENLRNKEVEISDDEFEAAQIAILLHDIGHGPFSHALEYSLLEEINHEEISKLIIMELNKNYNGRLEMALEIFNGTHKRAFLHQLVSSQLDIDRMDYLMRDSFFTGVSEGTIGAERIIKMLDVKDNKLVVEEKGIYSIENFLSARRLMYWQVYLHKTSVSAEKMLISIIRRAKELKKSGATLFASPALEVLLKQEIGLKDFSSNSFVLESFLKLDDYDIWGAIKIWADHDDPIISKLCEMLLNRKLFKIKLTTTPPNIAEIAIIENAIIDQYQLDPKDLPYFFSHGKVTNSAYKTSQGEISILSKSGEVRDVVNAADLPNIKAMSKMVSKFYRCWPKDISL